MDLVFISKEDHIEKIVRLGLHLLLFLVILPWEAFAQYTNEWIRPGQVYYRIPVAKKGIYKLTYADLQTAGVPVAAIDPRLIQLFHRGKEQSILVKGQSDAVLNTDDYIEFFGQANDGTLDKSLYKPSSYQPHNYYNLYSDTTAYFLTWNVGTIQGKRISNFDEVNVTNIPKEIYHNEERLLINKTQYSGGETQLDVIQYTHFDKGEGWTGNAIVQGQSIDYTIDFINNRETSSGNPQLNVLLVGRDQISHTAEILVGPNISSLRSVSTTAFNGFETINLSFTLNWSDISTDGKLVVRFSAASATTNRPQFSVSYLRLIYPQNFQSSGLIEKEFHLNANPSGKTFLGWDNAPADMRVWDITDPTTIISIGMRTSGTTQTAIVGSTETSRTLYAFTTTMTPPMKKVSFRLIDPVQSDFIIISNKLLMKPALSYNDPVKAYAGYRASVQGGSYDTLVVTMDQLYNQFNYGETSPAAIYEFMRFMVGKGQPKYLFLIGKGRDVYAGFHRINNPGTGVLKDLVPSAGLPGSDMNYTVGLAGTTYEPAVPTGRLSVTTPIEVANYLNKIKEIENAGIVQDWQKRGLHLSGGIRDYELPIFRSYMDGFKSTAEGIYWGGSITTLAKRDPSTVELINVSDEINEGVNLATFFGHSSPGNIDIDIGKVTDPVMGYNNVGKYPVFLINGCNAGSFFLNAELWGENWVNAANRGARNFIAHSSYGFASTLRSYSDYFYRVGYADSVFIKKGVGDIQKEVARQYMTSASPVMANITQVQQMMLLGDPAVRLFQHADPDYEITNSSLDLVSYDQKTITSLTDSFAIKIAVRNLGMVKNKPVKIKVTRTFRDGSTATYDSTFAPFVYQDTVMFKIYRGNEDGSGDNTFLVVIDPENKIKELNEKNNEATYARTISSSATINLIPIDYGIQNQTSVKLIWQSSDPLSAKRDYQLEVDTTLAFNSPLAIRKIISGKVIAQTTIDLLNADSTVYYWRTRFDKPTQGESKDWIVSSFSYIKNSGEGWAQLKKDQLRENFFSGLISEGEGTPFKFEENKTSIEIKTFGSNNPLPFTDVSVKINGSEYNLATQGLPCRNNTLNLIAFNKTTAVPYASIPFIFQDPRTCGREPQLINSLTATELETDLHELVNAIGVSDSVVLFSIGNPDYNGWSASVKSKLGELGVSLTDLNSLQSGEPIIIMGRKGASPGSTNLFRSSLTPADEQLIFLSKSITGRNVEGTMKSVLIGPANKWKTFNRLSPTIDMSDQVEFILYGVKNSGEEILITSDAVNGYDLSSISVNEFPFLRITYKVKDEVNLTPADWKNWVVLYEPVAEGVLLYKGTTTSKVVQEGESWNTRFAFANITNKNFSDSLTVELEVVTKENRQRLVKPFKIKQPAPNDTTFFDVTSSTIGKAGTNDVNVFVNNRVMSEQYYDNNFANLPSYLIVQPDRTRPLLEVTFDGRQIRNGDVVSSTPFIQLTVKDENAFMMKTDTSGITILLSYPCGTEDCPFVRIPLSSNQIKWYPATPDADFRVDFMPNTLVDGKYTFSVQATDASGNLSGTEPYEITFNVESETKLNFRGVYPNPSSIGFFFNFELSGNILPEEFSLEIFSSTGQLVSKFGIEDVQKFYIGTNEIIWNGADSTGKLLNNGVYLYRMRIKAGETDSVNNGRLIWLR